jgi:hypothetical protein
MCPLNVSLITHVVLGNATRNRMCRRCSFRARGLDPQKHLNKHKAHAPVRDGGVFIVGTAWPAVAAITAAAEQRPHELAWHRLPAFLFAARQVSASEGDADPEGHLAATNSRPAAEARLAAEAANQGATGTPSSNTNEIRISTTPARTIRFSPSSQPIG